MKWIWDQIDHPTFISDRRISKPKVQKVTHLHSSFIKKNSVQFPHENCFWKMSMELSYLQSQNKANLTLIKCLIIKKRRKWKSSKNKNLWSKSQHLRVWKLTKNTKTKCQRRTIATFVIYSQEVKEELLQHSSFTVRR